jgi:hypothetical protein
VACAAVSGPRSRGPRRSARASPGLDGATKPGLDVPVEKPGLDGLEKPGLDTAAPDTLAAWGGFDEAPAAALVVGASSGSAGVTSGRGAVLTVARGGPGSIAWRGGGSSLSTIGSTMGRARSYGAGSGRPGGRELRRTPTPTIGATERRSPCFTAGISGSVRDVDGGSGATSVVGSAVAASRGADCQPLVMRATLRGASASAPSDGIARSAVGGRIGARPYGDVARPSTVASAERGSRDAASARRVGAGLESPSDSATSESEPGTSSRAAVFVSRGASSGAGDSSAGDSIAIAGDSIADDWGASDWGASDWGASDWGASDFGASEGAAEPSSLSSTAASTWLRGTPIGSVVRPSGAGGIDECRAGGGGGGGSGSSGSSSHALAETFFETSVRWPRLSLPCSGGATYGTTPASRCRSCSMRRFCRAGGSMP